MPINILFSFIRRVVYFIQKPQRLFISVACSRCLFRSSYFYWLLICQILHSRDQIYSVSLSTNATCLRVYSFSAKIILEFLLCDKNTACIRMYILIFMLVNDDFFNCIAYVASNITMAVIRKEYTSCHGTF
jgi:hypothetical protein